MLDADMSGIPQADAARWRRSCCRTRAPGRYPRSKCPGTSCRASRWARPETDLAKLTAALRLTRTRTELRPWCRRQQRQVLEGKIARIVMTILLKDGPGFDIGSRHLHRASGLALSMTRSPYVPGRRRMFWRLCRRGQQLVCRIDGFVDALAMGSGAGAGACACANEEAIVSVNAAARTRITIWHQASSTCGADTYS